MTSFNRHQRLYLLLGGFFITNALLAEFVGTKIFSLEGTLGLPPLRFTLLGQAIEGINLTAGVIMWPFVFVLTDLVNEYYGTQGVRRLSFLTAGLLVYSFAMVYLAIGVAPAPFWAMLPGPGGDMDMQLAYSRVFGQGLWIILGSLVAFLIGQLVDVTSFHAIRRMTGPGRLWARATGSTFISQLIDSFVVLFIAFYLGAGWSFQQVLAISLVNYAYKVTAALLLTPLIYLAHRVIDRYLGHG